MLWNYYYYYFRSLFDATKVMWDQGTVIQVCIMVKPTAPTSQWGKGLTGKAKFVRGSTKTE